MNKLRRVHLDSAFTEASALLPVHSPRLLAALGTDQAWWIVHDEAGLTNMVSIVRKMDGASKDPDRRWSIVPVSLFAAGEPEAVTDGEALAYADGMVFTFGSAFVNRRGGLDSRRSFVARFAEDDVEVGPLELSSGEVRISAPAQVLALETELVGRLNIALEASSIEVMKLARKAANKLARSVESASPGGWSDQADGWHSSKADRSTGNMQPMNIEGAAIIGQDVLLGLRWPVSVKGRPLVAILRGGREALITSEWSRRRLFDCPISFRVIDGAGSPKRPAGVRAMSETDGELHVVCGPTERDLAATEVRGAKLQHLEVDLPTFRATEIRSFEGFRKVEALAPGRDKPRWLYALDDEDAVVLLEAGKSDT